MTVDQIRRNLGMPNIISGFKGSSEWWDGCSFGMGLGVRF
jgi:hypothetical protein